MFIINWIWIILMKNFIIQNKFVAQWRFFFFLRFNNYRILIVITEIKIIKKLFSRKKYMIRWCRFVLSARDLLVDTIQYTSKQDQGGPNHSFTWLILHGLSYQSRIRDNLQIFPQSSITLLYTPLHLLLKYFHQYPPTYIIRPVVSIQKKTK